MRILKGHIILPFLVIGIVLILEGSFCFAKACTEELKMCSNGRGVGRVGPNCEFAPCELPSSLEECKDKTDFWREWCYKDYAVEVSSDPLICQKIKMDDLKNLCYMGIASIADNIDICVQLPKFRNECIIHISENSNDPQLCNRLFGRKKAECYKNIGRNTLNPDLCEKASRYYYGDFDFKYICLRDIAIKRRESEFCSNLSDYGFTEDHYKHDCIKGFDASE